MFRWFFDRFSIGDDQQEIEEITYQWLVNNKLLDKKSDRIQIMKCEPQDRDKNTYYLWPSQKGGQYVGCWMSGDRAPRRYKSLSAACRSIRKHLKQRVEKALGLLPIQGVKCVDERLSLEKGRANCCYVWPSKSRLGMIGFRDSAGNDPHLVGSISALVKQLEKRSLS